MDANEFISKNKNTIFNLVIVLFAFYLALMIFKSQTKSLNMLIGQKENEVKRNEELTNIGILKKQYEGYVNFVNNKDVSGVINTISNIGMASGIKIVAVRPEQELEQPLYTKYPFTLKIEAKSYNDLGKFISQLESHANIFDVEIAKIYPAQGGNEKEASVQLSADLKVNTVFLKNQ